MGKEEKRYQGVSKLIAGKEWNGLWKIHCLGNQNVNYFIVSLAIEKKLYQL
jgi:hypothetical protein